MASPYHPSVTDSDPIQYPRFEEYNDSDGIAVATNTNDLAQDEDVADRLASCEATARDERDPFKRESDHFDGSPPPLNGVLAIRLASRQPAPSSGGTTLRTVLPTRSAPRSHHVHGQIHSSPAHHPTVGGLTVPGHTAPATQLILHRNRIRQHRRARELREIERVVEKYISMATERKQEIKFIQDIIDIFVAQTTRYQERCPDPSCSICRRVITLMADLRAVRPSDP